MAEKKRRIPIISDIMISLGFSEQRIPTAPYPQLMALMVMSCIGAAVCGYQWAVIKLEGRMGKYVPIVFSPGKDWTSLSAELARACPVAGEIAALGKPDATLDGWWTIKLEEPAVCAGASFSVPTAVVTPKT